MNLKILISLMIILLIITGCNCANNNKENTDPIKIKNFSNVKPDKVIQIEPLTTYNRYEIVLTSIKFDDHKWLITTSGRYPKNAKTIHHPDCRCY